MATQTEVLQAGVDADQFLVGPAVLLIQSTTNYDNTGEAADAYPRYIDDIINITSGVAMTANGWEYLGYTENIAWSRNRTITDHDSDQENRVKSVHDAWENAITVTALETSLAKLQDYLQGDSSDPSAVVGAPTAQQKVSVGNPLDINYRRAAIIQVDDLGVAWAYVFRKTILRPTGGPTWTRTGRVEWPLEMTGYSDTRTTDVNDRMLRIYKTNASIA